MPFELLAFTYFSLYLCGFLLQIQGVMELQLLPVFAFLSLALVASHAALSPAAYYWNSVLPNTPMPKTICNLLKPDLMEDKSTPLYEGKGNVNVNIGKKPGGGTNLNVSKGVVGIHTAKLGRKTNIGLGKGEDSFEYQYAASENQIHDDPRVALFFLEQNMQIGTEMKLEFTKSVNQGTFLPRQVAKSIPFSSNKLPEIFTIFSINPGSEKSDIMKNTIKKCEEPGIKGEEKYCATSLESMIDFVTSKLGKNVQAISTEVMKNTLLQKYIISGVKKKAGKEAVVCHKQNYMYAVFYCHKIHNIRVYSVPLVGTDGTKAEAVAVCHVDTSAWNPKHLAFHLLKVKPGSVPVCHFLPEDHVTWLSK